MNITTAIFPSPTNMTPEVYVFVGHTNNTEDIISSINPILLEPGLHLYGQTVMEVKKKINAQSLSSLAGFAVSAYISKFYNLNSSQ